MNSWDAKLHLHISTNKQILVNQIDIIKHKSEANIFNAHTNLMMIYTQMVTQKGVAES